MKPGTLITRVVMVLLFLTVVAYFGLSVLKGMEDSYETTIIYTYTAEERTETSGYIVREETCIPTQSGMVDVVLSEGSSVAKNGVIAKVYQDASALELQSELETLAQEIEQLQYVTGRNLESADTAELNASIIKSMTELKASVSARDLSNLDTAASDLKTLIFRRDYTYNGESSLDQLLAEKQAAYQSLLQQTAQSVSSVRASVAGTFSSQVDGYETILTPESITTLTPSGLDALAENVPEVEEGSWLGKIITSSRWYYVCTMTEEEAQAMDSKVTLRFTRGYSRELNMDVERISDSENGRVVVILSTNEFVSETTLLRRQSADVIYSSATGLRVPKEAIRLQEVTETGEVTVTQQPGVYCVSGQKWEWKAVNILWEADDYYLVEGALPEVYETKDEAQALHAGDEVLVKGETVYDGKAVG